jgi:hypothetical protein
MLGIVKNFVESDELKEKATKAIIGDKIVRFKESTLRRFCSGIGAASGLGVGGITGVVINNAALAVGAPGALFVVVGSVTVGALTFDISNGVCKDVLDKAALAPYSEGGPLIEYEGISKFCERIFNMDGDKMGPRFIKKIGKFVGRCGRYRILKAEEL